jgi:hypothetical protein
MTTETSDMIDDYAPIDLHDDNAFEAAYEDASDNIDPDEVECAFNMNINAIKADFNAASMPCLVCEVVLGKAPTDNHKFEDCPILKDSTSLRKQFISFCSTIRKTRKAQERSIKHLKLSATTHTDNVDMSNHDTDDTQPSDFR